MTPLESALSAWIAFHGELGVDMQAYLLPPATEKQVVAVEEKIGYRLPEDLRELYKIANGQWVMYDDDESLITVDGEARWAPLFGNYEFLTLDRALERYEFYLDMYTSEAEFNTKYYAANPDQHYEPTVWEVREGDAVDEAGWNPQWFTFAGSGANGYSVDMAPPRGGAPGQVVLHGADEWVLQVVGHSVTDMMEQAVTHLSPDEEHRYDYNERDGGYMANVFFNIDWRAELYIPEEQRETPAAYVEWMNEQSLADEEQREKLDLWLQGRNLSEEQRNSYMEWLSYMSIRNTPKMPPMSVIMEMQMQRLAQGELPDFSEVIDGIGAGMQPDEKTMDLREHAMSLATLHLRSDAMFSPFDISMTVDEAVALYHDYKFETGEWTQDEVNRIKKFEVDVKNLPVNIEDGFSMMSSTDSTLTVCTSSFDEETYKSTETCFDVDLTGL